MINSIRVPCTYALSEYRNKLVCADHILHILVITLNTRSYVYIELGDLQKVKELSFSYYSYYRTLGEIRSVGKGSCRPSPSHLPDMWRTSCTLSSPLFADLLIRPFHVVGSSAQASIHILFNNVERKEKTMKMHLQDERGLCSPYTIV